MYAFVVSATIFAVLFGALLALNPDRHDRLAYLARGFANQLERSSWFREVLLAAILLSPFAVLYLISEALELSSVPPVGPLLYIQSPTFLSAALGAFFGAILVVWVNRLYRLQPGEKPSPLVVADALLLLVLFIVGAWDRLGPFFDRVSDVEIAGTKISLAQAPLASRPVDYRAPEVQLHSGNDEAKGLVAGYHSFLERENRFLSEVDKGKSFNPDAFDSFIERLIVPLVKCQAVDPYIDRFLLRDRYRGLVLALTAIKLQRGTNAAVIDQGLQSFVAESLEGAAQRALADVNRLDSGCKELSDVYANRSQVAATVSSYLASKEKPYEKVKLALVRQDLAMALGERDLAFSILADLDSVLNKASGQENSWARARVLWTIVILLEQKAGTTVDLPQVYKTYLVDEYKRAIEAAEAIKFVRDNRSYFNISSDPKTASVRLLPYDTKDCLVKNETVKRALPVVYTQITNMMNFVNRALEEPNYQKHYSSDVENYLSQLNAADFSCLSVIETVDKVPVTTRMKLLHAEILRLDAKKIIVEAPRTLLLQGKDALNSRVQDARLEINAAKALLEEAQENEVVRRLNANTWQERVQPSIITDTYDDINSTARALAMQLPPGTAVYEAERNP